jgi:hypothetical protein
MIVSEKREKKVKKGKKERRMKSYRLVDKTEEAQRI